MAARRASGCQKGVQHMDNEVSASLSYFFFFFYKKRQSEVEGEEIRPAECAAMAAKQSCEHFATRQKVGPTPFVGSQVRRPGVQTRTSLAGGYNRMALRINKVDL